MMLSIRAAAIVIAAGLLIATALGQSPEKTVDSRRLPNTGAAVSAAVEAIETTVCELQASPLRFTGKNVRIRATLAGDFEMSILLDDSCPHSDVIIWYGLGTADTDTSQYAFIDSIDALKKPNEIQWQSPVPTLFRETKASKKLSQYARGREKRAGDFTVTATFEGRFDYIPNAKWLALKALDGKLRVLSAFGHLNCCSARLVPQYVIELALPKAVARKRP